MKKIMMIVSMDKISSQNPNLFSNNKVLEVQKKILEIKQ